MRSTKVQGNRGGNRSPPRRALTLVELVVVMAILIVLSSLIVPLIQGLGFQTNAATNATVIDDVNRAMLSYAARTGNEPDNWDSLLSTTGSRFTKLHPELSAHHLPNGTIVNLLQESTLTKEQVASLNKVGIYNVRDASESSTVAPNLNSGTTRKLVENGKIMKLSSSGIATLGGEFQETQAGSVVPPPSELIVLGLGGNVTVQGATMMQAPLIQNADPANHYARVCCVYQIPSDAAAVAAAALGQTLPARYIGCFMPDGTSNRKNMENYNNNAAAN